jgi:hypothetical protein
MSYQGFNFKKAVHAIPQMKGAVFSKWVLIGSNGIRAIY